MSRVRSLLAASSAGALALVAAATAQPARAHDSDGWVTGIPGFAPRDRRNARILKTWTVGNHEFTLHATKGLRRRRVVWS